MKKLLVSAALLSTLGASSIAMADNAQFTMGPYANMGAGLGIFSASDSDFNLSVTGFNGKVGVGVLQPLNQDANPFFAGAEVNGDYFRAADQNVWGADAAAIVGKQIDQQLGIFAKAGGNYLTNHGDHTYGPIVGGGLAYQIAPKVKAVTEASYGFEKDSLRLTTVTAGLQYDMGW